LSKPTATKRKRTKNRKVVTETRLKNIFDTTKSYFVPPQPRCQNISSNKTCNNQNRVSKRKAAMSLMSRKIELKKLQDFVEASFRLTVGYCCRQGIHCCVRPQPLMNKDIKVKDNKQKPKDACPAETEADSEPQPKITTSCPACSNTFVVRSCFHLTLIKLSILMVNFFAPFSFK